MPHTTLVLLARRAIVLIAPLLCAVSGCMSAYRAYHDCCCIPYDYCPRAPLPYVDYCGCPTPMAEAYEGKRPPGAEMIVPPPVPDEAAQP